MKYFPYYVYFRLYQASEKRGKSTPLFLTVVWLTITLLCNVIMVLSLITICTGLDVGYVFSIPTSTWAILAWMSALELLLWLGLKFFHVHETAFSAEAVKKYKELGFKGWWVVAYFIASYVAMGWSAWVAGGHLRMH